MKSRTQRDYIEALVKMADGQQSDITEIVALLGKESFDEDFQCASNLVFRWTVQRELRAIREALETLAGTRKGG